MQAQSNSPKMDPRASPLASSNNNNNNKSTSSAVVVYVPVSMRAKNQSGQESNAVTTSLVSKNDASHASNKNKENTHYPVNTHYKTLENRHKRQQQSSNDAASLVSSTNATSLASKNDDTSHASNKHKENTPHYSVTTHYHKRLDNRYKRQKSNGALVSKRPWNQQRSGASSADAQQWQRGESVQDAKSSAAVTSVSETMSRRHARIQGRKLEQARSVSTTQDLEDTIIKSEQTVDSNKSQHYSTSTNSNKRKQEPGTKSLDLDRTGPMVSYELQKSRNKNDERTRTESKKALPAIDLGPLFGHSNPCHKCAAITDNGIKEQANPPKSHSSTAPRMEPEKKQGKAAKLDRTKSAAGKPNSQQESQQKRGGLKNDQRVKRIHPATILSRKPKDASSKEAASQILPPKVAVMSGRVHTHVSSGGASSILPPKVSVLSSNTHPRVTAPGRIHTYAPSGGAPTTLSMSRIDNGRLKWQISPQHVVAMSCEMVGVGADGKRSMLARVSLVDWNGTVLLDTFVAPQEHVTDYRTLISGIQPHHLVSHYALDFLSVRKLVYNWLKAKPVLIGHGLTSALDALNLTRPWYLIRDSATYLPFTKPGSYAPKRLVDLAREELGISLQQDGAERCSVVLRAGVAMELYKHKQTEWDLCIEDHWNANPFARAP